MNRRAKHKGRQRAKAAKVSHPHAFNGIPVAGRATWQQREAMIGEHCVVLRGLRGTHGAGPSGLLYPRTARRSGSRQAPRFGRYGARPLGPGLT